MWINEQGHSRPGCGCHLIPTLERIGLDDALVRLITRHMSNDPNDEAFIIHMNAEEKYLIPYVPNPVDRAILNADHARYRDMIRRGIRVADDDIRRHTILEKTLFDQIK